MSLSRPLNPYLPPHSPLIHREPRVSSLQSAYSVAECNILQTAYRHMARARLIDDKAITLYKQNKCHFQIGVAGHEAVQVAAAMIFRGGVDWFFPYYRDMALVAALGITDREFGLTFLNKDDDPNSHGRQMPMHYARVDLNIVSQSSPTGTQYLQAVGCGLGSRLRQKDEVIYVSSGEGACAQGDFHEALNWSSRDRLPVIFLIQNNGFAISVPIEEQLAGKSVSKLCRGYEGLTAYEVDGTNPLACYHTFAEAHQRARNGEGPSVIEAHVPRLQSHSISDNQFKYRSSEDVARDQERCPTRTLRELLIREGLSTDEELRSLEHSLKEELDDAVTWAEAQPDPDPRDVEQATLTLPDPALLGEESLPQGESVYLVDAINHTLHEELGVNPLALVFGQDVARGKGGVFTVTSGLTEKFGDSRAFNTQLAESSIIGASIGLSLMGFTPIPEIQFGDYIWTAMMQIRNEVAMMSYRSRGDFTCPMVVRVPVGGYIRGSAYHSQNIEATFAHFPGLLIAYPSNASDAQGLLRSALKSKNPILFLEHKGLYRQPYAKGREGDSHFRIPFGKARIVREGDDLTLVTYGACVQKSILVAEQLASNGHSLEIIDLRTIVPLDFASIRKSIEKTNRVLIVHEDVTFMGFGAEIAAQINEECFSMLDAPIQRVGMRYVSHVPHAEALEEAALPQVNTILEKAMATLAY
jgi:2-oxoisovalerate dehydrogenase E1 component